MARGRPPRGSDLDAERLDPLTLLRKPSAEIAMVIGPRFGRAILGRFSQAAGAVKLERPISRSEVDPYAYVNAVGSGAIVLAGLLRAVADAVEARPLHELRIRRVDLDFRDIRAGLGRRKHLQVREKSSRRSYI